MRKCGECTKCCDGWLKANIGGKIMEPGTPCQFVKCGVGCTDYQNRPINPCVTFKCLWLTNEVIPDFMRPDKSGLIFKWSSINFIKFIDVIETDKKITPKTFTFIKDLSTLSRLNVKYTYEGVVHCSGSKNFLEAMDVKIKEKNNKKDKKE